MRCCGNNREARSMVGRREVEGDVSVEQVNGERHPRGAFCGYRTVWMQHLYSESWVSQRVEGGTNQGRARATP